MQWQTGRRQLSGRAVEVLVSADGSTFSEKDQAIGRKRAVRATLQGVNRPSEANRVLLVEDDPHVREGLCLALSLSGYVVFEASNGREALQIMRGRHPDVMVLDLHLSEIDGWEVLRERKSDPALAAIPVIVSSGSEVALTSSLPEGVSAYLTKPYEIEVLVHAIARALGRDAHR